ncbi:MAG: AAA family ATPase [Thiogranum sp.]
MESFSLTCEPFANTIDNRFFYGGTTLMQRLDLLSHLTQFGDSVILVAGPAGSGKTTLLSRFTGQANSQWRMCLLNGDEFDRFPQRLADTLQSETPAGEQELLAEWAARTDNSQLLVIVIDNSEHLDSNAFERLCALLEGSNANRVRLILFGTPEAQQSHRQALEQKQLEFSTQLLEMPRMSEEETASYLMYRLAVAGYSGENPFTATEIRAICKASDGRPAAINELARQALEEHQARAGSKRVRVRQGARKVGSLTWGLGSAAILILAVWLGWHKLYPPVTDQAPAAQIAMEERPLAIPAPAPLRTPAEPPVPADPSGGNDNDSIETTPGEPQQAAPDAKNTPLAMVATGLKASETDRVPESPAETPPTAGSGAKSPPATGGGQTSPAMTQAAPEPASGADAIDNAQVAPPSPAGIAAPETARETTPAAVTSAAPEPAPADPPASAATAQPVATPEPLPHDERWLLQQPETAFTLQLLGSRNAESITRYLEHHHLDISQAAIYKGLYKNAEWYVLLYGIYPSRQAAIDARAGLPAAIRKGKPWPRTLQTVHNAIQEAR